MPPHAMRITGAIPAPPSQQRHILRRLKLQTLFSSDPANLDKYPNDDSSYSNSSISSSSPSSTTENSSTSSKNSSPWSQPPGAHQPETRSSPEYALKHCLIGSLFLEEGHIYSLAAARDLLFTGSESKNVRVWKNLKDFTGFKSRSGMVKAIIVMGEKIFTGHQDGKIRVWTFLDGERSTYNRIGNLPRTRDLLMKSMNPRNYVEVRRKRNVPWIKHYDTVSCMSIDDDHGLLYSGSWDKSMKVWRISDSKCLESIQAHDDAINSVVMAAQGVVLTGSADGTVKAWRRKFVGKRTKHLLVETLLKQEHAVTALAVSLAAATAVFYGGTSDGLVRFWEVEKRCMAYGGVLRGHKLAVLCLVVGGKLVLSGSADKSICVWRIYSGGVHSCMAVLTGHGGPVKCLAVKQDMSMAAEEEEEEEGHRRWIVYSGSLDKSVKIWRVSE